MKMKLRMTPEQVLEQAVKSIGGREYRQHRVRPKMRAART
jgi:hypothetical protein